MIGVLCVKNRQTHTVQFPTGRKKNRVGMSVVGTTDECACSRLFDMPRGEQGEQTNYTLSLDTTADPSLNSIHHGDKR